MIKRHKNFKGGSIASTGYKIQYVGKGHHLADVRGYTYEHRIVAERKIGRRLEKGEIVHHINGDKLDNREENIEVHHSRFDHKVRHRKNDSGRRMPRERNPEILCGCGCGRKLLLYDSNGRPRKYIAGHWRKGRKGGWK